MLGLEKVSLYELRALLILILLCTPHVLGTAEAEWLRCCATNRKAAGSIPVGVGIFHRQNPSDRTMALGLTQPLTEMKTRSISWW